MEFPPMAALLLFFSFFLSPSENRFQSAGWESFIICVQQKLHIAAICIQQRISMMMFSNPVFLLMPISCFPYYSRYSYQVYMDYNAIFLFCQSRFYIFLQFRHARQEHSNAKNRMLPLPVPHTVSLYFLPSFSCLFSSP